MAKGNLSRREFISLTSLTGLATITSLDSLAKIMGVPDPKKFINYACRMVDYKSLLNLEFYFVGVNKTPAGNLEGCNGVESFMIVRLPQQHIAETFFMPKPGEDDPDCNHPPKVQTRIAGYSYLVFRIFFQENNGRNLDKAGFLLTPQNLLNWNAPYLRLIVREDRSIAQNIFEPRKSAIPPGESKQTKEPPALVYPLGYKNQVGKLKFDRESFPQWGPTLHSRQQPYPFTAIEAPYHLVLSPELPNHNYVFKWSFSRSARKKDKKIDAAGNEIWMATLSVTLDPERYLEKQRAPIKQSLLNKLLHGTKLPNPDQDKEKPAAPVADLPMAMTMIGADSTKNANGFGTLPTEKDKSTLTQLYFLSQTVLRSKSKKLAFTPLGICGTIEFQNVLINQILKKHSELNLFEWKQSMSFGRDQEVQVVDLMKDMCTGHMMLHIKTTKRRAICGTAYLGYSEYLVPLETEKNYLEYDPGDDAKYSQPNFKFNTPFKSIRFATLKPKRIFPLANKENYPYKDVTWQSDEAASTAAADQTRIPAGELSTDTPCLAFWAKKPSPDPKTPKDPKTPMETGYLEWEYIGTDWQDNEVHFTKRLYLVSSLLQGSIDSKATPSKYLLPPLDGFQALSQRISDPSVTNKIKDVEKDLVAVINADSKWTEWTSILAQSEQFLLTKSDLFRQHLEQIFEGINRDVAAVYQKNPEWTDGQDELEEAIRQFKSEYYKTVQSSSAEIRTLIKKLKDEAAKLLSNNDELTNIARQVTYYASLPGDYLDNFIKEKAIDLGARAESIPFQTAYNELHAAIDVLDNDIDAFVQGVSAKLNLQENLKDRFKQVKQIYCFLEHVEHDCNSRLDTFKTRIGVAVYKVNDGIDDLKEQVKKIAKEKWERVYQKIEDYYHKANKEISTIETQAIIFRNNVRKLGDSAMDFFDSNATRLNLHSLQGSIKKVNDTVHKEVALRFSYAEHYLKNQVDHTVLEVKNNALQIFAQIHSESKEFLKGAMREIGNEMGGLVNPELASDLLSYYHDARDVVENGKAEVVEGLNEIKDSLSELDRQFKAEKDALVSAVGNELGSAKADLKTLIDSKEAVFRKQFDEQKNKLVLLAKDVQGEINKGVSEVKKEVESVKNEAINVFKGLEAKILGSLKLKDILGIDAEPPKYNKTEKSIYYNFITNKFLKSVQIGTISFNTFDSTRLVCYLEKSIAEANKFTSQTRLENFQIGVFDERIVVKFNKLEILSNENVKNKVSVEIADVHFQKELAFLEALSKNIKVPGTGLTLDIAPTEVRAKYSYTFPGISGGAFTLTNLKFGVGVTIPFPIGGGKLKPIVASFGINAPNDKFVVAAGIYGGRGHFVLETTPRYIKTIDCSLEFGGYFGLSLGIASGEAYLMAGIRYVFTRNSEGQSSMTFYGYVTAGGSVTVFGFITISVCFLLCMVYEKTDAGSSLYGTASLTLSVKIGFFEKSFTLTFTKRMAGTDNAGVSSETAFNEIDDRLPINQYAVYHPDSDSGLASYAGYENQYPGDDRWHREKPEPVFTDEGWTAFCQSFFPKLKPTADVNQHHSDSRSATGK